MKDKRPVNLDIGSMRLPITATTSILHRASGIILVFGIAVLLSLLDASLASEESFNALKESAGSFWCKLIIWGVLSALCYHIVAGVKHLIMDAGIGESFEGGQKGSKIVLVVAAVLIVLMGILVW